MSSGTTMKLDTDPVVREGSHRRPSFLMGLPSFGTVPIEFCVAVMRLASPMNCISQMMMVKRFEIGAARDEIARYYVAQSPRPSYLFFLGDDMLPPWDGLIKLWDTMEEGHWDILSGLYYLKTEPPTPVMWRANNEGHMRAGIDFKVGEVVSVDICGLDFCLIRPEVFEAIEPPYFQTQVTFKESDALGNGAMYKSTEDGYFLRKAKAAGKRVGVHTGIRVSHIDVKTGMVY